MVCCVIFISLSHAVPWLIMAWRPTDVTNQQAQLFDVKIRQSQPHCEIVSCNDITLNAVPIIEYAVKYMYACSHATPSAGYWRRIMITAHQSHLILWSQVEQSRFSNLATASSGSSFHDDVFAIGSPLPAIAQCGADIQLWELSKIYNVFMICTHCF